MSLSRMPFVVGFLAGFLSITAVPMASAPGVNAAPAIPVQELARLSWPHLSGTQQQMVDLLARDIYERDLAPEQRQRIGGSINAVYETLPDWRKAPFRGMAMRDLGLEAPDSIKRAI